MNALSDREVLTACRRSLSKHGKTFALAGTLLSSQALDRAAALYAYCRAVDDAIDEVEPSLQLVALEGARSDLDHIYGAASLRSVEHRAMRALVREAHIPRSYVESLLEGMAMDVRGERYETFADLLLYCHRVAGVVGLMMCHVLGVSRDGALREAAHLGIAMQLTNICRDVAEDRARGRLYLPHDMLRQAGAVRLADGPIDQPWDAETISGVQHVTRELLQIADRYYASADRGLSALPFRAGLSIRSARGLYRAIGEVISAQDFHPQRGRAVVPRLRKLQLVGQSLYEHAASLPGVMSDRALQVRLPRTPAVVLNEQTVLASL